MTNELCDYSPRGVGAYLTEGETVGGKPNPGTKPDRRLKRNKGKKKR